MVGPDRNVGCRVQNCIGQADVTVTALSRLAGFTTQLTLELNMTKTFAGCCSMLLALGLQVFPAGLGSAQAATPGQEEVTVDGPYTVRQELTKRALGGEMSETTLSVSQHVSYADLDLSKADDVAKLRERVKTAAADSCRELQRRFPSLTYIPMPYQTPYQCARTAAGPALARVDAITSQSVARADTGMSPSRY
jgi:hypothetical protein